MNQFFLHRYDLKTDQRLFDAVKLISHEIAPCYQAQNDFLDCFGKADQLNKPGHDIQNAQFSWFATMTMERGTEQQKDIMRKCYGKHGKVKRI